MRGTAEGEGRVRKSQAQRAEPGGLSEGGACDRVAQVAPTVITPHPYPTPTSQWETDHKKPHTTTVTPHAEKLMCSGTLGRSSCSLPTIDRNDRVVNITFLWKNEIEADPTSQANVTHTSDICAAAASQNSTLSDCLGDLFAGASSNDVLLIGSSVIGRSLDELYQKCGGCKASRALCVHGPLMATSIASERAERLLKALLAAFPGQVRTRQERVGA